MSPISLQRQRTWDTSSQTPSKLGTGAHHEPDHIEAVPVEPALEISEDQTSDAGTTFEDSEDENRSTTSFEDIDSDLEGEGQKVVYDYPDEHALDPLRVFTAEPSGYDSEDDTVETPTQSSFDFTQIPTRSSKYPQDQQHGPFKNRFSESGRSSKSLQLLRKLNRAQREKHGLYSDKSGHRLSLGALEETGDSEEESNRCEKEVDRSPSDISATEIESLSSSDEAESSGPLTGQDL